LEVEKKRISFYKNGKKLKGLEFKKIQGKVFFPVVNVGNLESLEVNYSPKYPKGVEKEEGSESEEEEEEKPKKSKIIYSEPKSFSKFYEEYYNNKTFSDYQIKVENSEEIIYVHKIVLAGHSEGT
jgi:hypothetical protein